MAWWWYCDNHLDGDKNQYADNKNDDNCDYADKKIITLTIKMKKKYKNGDNKNDQNYHNDNKVKIMMIPDVVEVRRSQQTLSGNPEYSI